MSPWVALWLPLTTYRGLVGQRPRNRSRSNLNRSLKSLNADAKPSLRQVRCQTECDPLCVLPRPSHRVILIHRGGVLSGRATPHKFFGSQSSCLFWLADTAGPRSCSWKPGCRYKTLRRPAVPPREPPLGTPDRAFLTQMPYELLPACGI